MSTRASELIEDFMIAANTCTAQFLETRGFASIRRIVRMPERWPRIVTLAGRQEPRSRLRRTRAPSSDGCCSRRGSDPDRFADLSLSVVKLLVGGEYVVEQPSRADAGSLRPGRRRLHAFDGAETGDSPTW